MTVIGSAYVNIRAITTELERDIRKTVEAIKDTITIKVDADVTAAVAQIDAISASDQTVHVNADTTKAVEDIRTVWSESFNATMEVDANTAVARAEFEHMRDDMDGTNVSIDVNLHDVVAKARLALLTRVRTLRVNVLADTGPLRNIGNYLSRLSGLRVATGHAKELVEEFANIDKMVPTIATMAVKLGALSSAAISAVGGLLTLGASLGNIIQMLGFAAPGVLAGFAVGIGTLMVALKNFGKQLPDVTAAYKGLAGVIQQNFWSVAREPIRDMAMTLLPLFRSGLAETSKALGGWASALAGAMKQSLTPDTLSFMFGNLSKSIDIATQANAPFVSAMVELGKVGSALLPRLAQWWVEVANKFNDFIKASVENGNMSDWIEQGITALKQLGRVVSDVAAIFSTLTGAAQVAGSDGLGTIVKTLDNIRAAVNSPEGARALITIFEGAYTASGALSGAISQIIGALGNAAPAIKAGFGSVGAVITLIGDAISNIIKDPAFQAGFTEMFAGIQKGAEALIPVLGTTGPKIGALLSIIGNLAANMGGILGKALEISLPLITEFKKAIDPLIPILGDALIKIIGALAPLFTTLAGAIAKAAPVVAVVVKVIADLVSGLAEGLGPALPGIIMALIPLLAGFKAFQGATAIIAGLVSGFKGFFAIGQLLVGLSKNFGIMKFAIEGVVTGMKLLGAAFMANPIGIVIGLVAALVTGFVLAYNNIGWFKDGVDAAMKWIGEAIGNVVDFWNSEVVPMWNTAMQAAGDFFGAIGTWIGDAINAVGDFFNGFGKGAGDATNALGDFFGGIGKGISDAFNGAVGFVTDTMNNISKVIGDIGNGIADTWNAIWTNVSSFFTDVWNGLVTFFQPITDFIGAIFNLIGAIIQGGIDIFVAIWTAGWEIVSTIFYGIWINLVRFFTPIIDGISTAISDFINGVVAVWNTTWQAISDFFVAVWTNLVGFVTPIIQSISDTITNIVNGIAAVWNAVWQSIVDYFTFVWNTLVAIYTPILQGIADFIGAVVNGIAATWNAVWSGISGFFGAIWNSIVSIVQTYVIAVSSIIISVVSGISGFWNATWSAISGFVSSVWNGIVNGVSGFVNQVGSYIGNVLNRMGQIGSDIMGKVAGFPSLLISAGTDLINGLVNGIQNASGAVVRKIQEIASGALDAIKNFFGIKSPSRVMRDQVGKQIGAGLAIGIEQSVGRVSKAVATLSDAAMMTVPDVQLGSINAGSLTYSGASQPVLSAATISGQGASTYSNYGGYPTSNPSSPNIMLQVNPSAALDEEKVGKIAASELYWQFTNR